MAGLLHRRSADWLLAAEALLLLAIFRAALAAIPVRRILGLISRRSPGGRCPDNPPDAKATARRVEWAVSAAARHSPIEFVCFPLALAGYVMLRRRHVASTVMYGVARSGEGELVAHAWLEAGGRVILGAEAARDFELLQQWS